MAGQFFNVCRVLKAGEAPHFISLAGEFTGDGETDLSRGPGYQNLFTIDHIAGLDYCVVRILVLQRLLTRVFCRRQVMPRPFPASLFPTSLLPAVPERSCLSSRSSRWHGLLCGTVRRYKAKHT